VQCNDVGQMLPEALDRALVLAKEQGKVRARIQACINSYVLQVPVALCIHTCREHSALNVQLHVLFVAGKVHALVFLYSREQSGLSCSTSSLSHAPAVGYVNCSKAA
jgi:hypothetical protein